MRTIAVAVLACAVMPGAGTAVSTQGKPAASKAERVEIKLPHQGDVFGEGPEWDKQFAREALQIFSDLRPDPAWVAKLKALPDNTWLPCSPKGDQQPELGRGEVPMVYCPAAHAFLFCCGCTNPGYSSDTWAYHSGANRWVQMWPNFIKGSDGKTLNKEDWPQGRPFTRCSLGLASDTDRKLVIVRGGANSMDGQTWAWNPVTNEWKVVAPKGTGYDRPSMEGNCLGYAAGFGVVEVGKEDPKSPATCTWVFRAQTQKWEPLATKGGPPGGTCSRMVWASGPQRLIFSASGVLWAFDPKTLTWENISPKSGPSPGGAYRQGIAYDSANNVVIMYGFKDWKDNFGPWVYSFETKTWTVMKTSNGPKEMNSGTEGGQVMMMDYDPEYNVLVIACNNRGTWAYRYKRAPENSRK